MSGTEPAPPAAPPTTEPATTEPADQLTPAAQLTPAQADRAGRSTRDIVLSLAALLLPILVLVGVYQVFFGGDKPIAIDVSETYATARHANAFPVLEPQPLPAGWSANAATYTPPASPGTSDATAGAVLRVVYHAPGGAGVQLVESSGPSDAVLQQELGANAQPGNLVSVGGQQWREYPSLGSGNAALVSVADTRTTVLIGQTSLDRLRELATALH